MFGVTRSAGTRRIPTDDHSVAPPNVACGHHAGRSRMFPTVAARDAVLSLESSNCSNVPPATNPTGPCGSLQNGLELPRNHSPSPISPHLF